MKKYKITKISMPAILMAFIGLFASIVSIVMTVVESNGNSPFYAMISMLSLACYIILIAGLSTKKGALVRAFLITMICVIAFSSFIISIIEIASLSNAVVKGFDLILSLTFALCLFADSILFLIYFLNKNDAVKPLKKITNILLVAFSFGYMVTNIVIQCATDLYDYTFQPALTGILLLLVLATLTPLLLDYAFDKEEPEDTKIVEVESVDKK